MIRMTIIDDQLEYCKKISEIAIKFFEQSDRACIVEKYIHPRDVLWEIEEKHISDIYCLDIEMPGIHGTELAHQIRLKDERAYIIFITSHNDMAVEGYEHQAWRFIIKGTEQEKLPKALASILEDMDRSMENRKYYIVENNSTIARFACDDIYYLKVDKKYTLFYTRNGIYRERRPLAQVMKKLNSPEFYYIDKGIVVNFNHVISITEKVRMRDDTLLDVSRGQKQKVKHALSDYWRQFL